VAQVATVDDFGNALGGAISVGDTIVGQYRYLSTTPDSNALPAVGDYWHSSSPHGITLDIGGFTFETDPDNVRFLVEILNDHTGQDAYLLRSYNNLPLSNGVSVEHIAWQLDDFTTSALSSAALPTVAPDLSVWQSNFGLTMEGCASPDPCGFCMYDRFFIRAHVTSVACAYSDPVAVLVTIVEQLDAAGLIEQKNGAQTLKNKLLKAVQRQIDAGEIQ
jgi:hypothetical protein